MGSDDRFKKRKAKRLEELARRAATRESKERVLIVSEGKTELLYIKGLIADLPLTNAILQPHTNPKASDPLSIVNYALEKYETDTDIDRVYCVFDKDTHATYDTAVEKIRSTKLGLGKELIAIKSIPCFEFWLLLHFSARTRPFASVGRKSACARIIEVLKKHLPNYKKGMRGLYDSIKDQTDLAIKNSKTVRKQVKATGGDNPTTEMDLLVSYLKRTAR